MWPLISSRLAANAATGQQGSGLSQLVLQWKVDRDMRPGAGRAADMDRAAQGLDTGCGPHLHPVINKLPTGGSSAAVHGVWPRIPPIARADSFGFTKNPAAGLSAISSA